MLLHALMGGILASIAWAGLLWSSPDPLPPPKLWWMGITAFLFGNSLLWLLLTSLNLKIWWLWLICLLIANITVSSRLPTPIPPPWRIAIHPTIVSSLVFLLAGSLGAI